MLEFSRRYLFRMKFFGILSIVLAVFCALAQSEIPYGKRGDLSSIQPQKKNVDIPTTKNKTPTTVHEN